MALKRRRSSEYLSPSPSHFANNGTQSSSPLPFFYPQSKPVESFTHKSSAWTPTTRESSLSCSQPYSRTKKRHRDDRPDEQAVYGVSCWLGAVINMSTLADVCRCAASTINKLYEAQRQHPTASPIMSNASSTTTTSLFPHRQQKSTLHAFWNIHQSPPGYSLSPLEPNWGGMVIDGSRCEDCDRSVTSDDAMDIDSAFEQVHGCQSCTRLVCDTCAVLGDVRLCLPCAGSRR